MDRKSCPPGQVFSKDMNACVIPEQEIGGEFWRIRVVDPKICKKGKFGTQDPGRPGHMQRIGCQLKEGKDKFYVKDTIPYRLTIATKPEIRNKVKASKDGFWIDEENMKMYIIFNNEYYPKRQGFQKLDVSNDWITQAFRLSKNDFLNTGKTLVPLNDKADQTLNNITKGGRRKLKWKRGTSDFNMF